MGRRAAARRDARADRRARRQPRTGKRLYVLLRRLVNPLGLTLALAVGLSLGLLGGGGSVLTVPIFKYVLGFDAKPAIAMSLIVVGALSLIGAARHWKAGRVDFRIAAIMGGIAIPASYVAARLAAFIPG